MRSTLSSAPASEVRWRGDSDIPAGQADLALSTVKDWEGSIGVRAFERRDRGEARLCPTRHVVSLNVTGPVRIGLREEGGRYTEARLGPGQMLIRPAGLDATAWADPARFEGVLLPPAMFSEPNLEMATGGVELVLNYGFQDSLIEQVVRELVKEAAAPCRMARLLVDGLANVLVMRLAQVFGPGRKALTPGLAGPRLRRVLDYIETRLAEELTLAELAAVACLSTSHFSRSFTQVMGMGPHRYVTTRRIERAKLLLRPGGQPLAAIAASLGFGDQAHFTNVFRTQTGFTPGRFRNSLR